MAEIIAPPRADASAGPSLSHWLGSKLCNQPLAMEADIAARFLEAIKDRAFDPKLSVDVVGASKFAGTRDQRSGYRVTDDGIALVPIHGILLDRGAWLGDRGGWMTSYEGIVEQCRRIKKDSAIKAVALDIDSGGGMAAGVSEAADAIIDLRKTKPVYAIAANMAASAAYWLGCAADEFVVTSGAMVGSIGVIQMHSSLAGMLERIGMEVTIVHAGKNKPNGNPYQPLSHLARHEMSNEIDRLYDQFVQHVASHRPMKEDAVRATEARVYFGERAVSERLADAVMSFDGLLSHVRKGLKAGRGKPPKGGRMSTTDTPAAQQPDYAALVAAITTSMAAAQVVKPAAPAVKEEAPAAVPAAATPAVPAQPSAAQTERARIKAIVDSDEGKARAGLASHLAYETDMTAEAAAKILAAAPKESTEAIAAENTSSGLDSALEKQMANSGNAGNIKPEATGAVSKKSFSQFAAEAPPRRQAKGNWA